MSDSIQLIELSPPSNSDTTSLTPNSSECECVWRKNILEVFALKEGPLYSLTDKTLRTLVHGNSIQTPALRPATCSTAPSSKTMSLGWPRPLLQHLPVKLKVARRIIQFFYTWREVPDLLFIGHLQLWFLPPSLQYAHVLPTAQNSLFHESESHSFEILLSGRIGAQSSSLCGRMESWLQ